MFLEAVQSVCNQSCLSKEGGGAKAERFTAAMHRATACSDSNRRLRRQEEAERVASVGSASLEWKRSSQQTETASRGSLLMQSGVDLSESSRQHTHAIGMKQSAVRDTVKKQHAHATGKRLARVLDAGGSEGMTCNVAFTIPLCKRGPERSHLRCYGKGGVGPQTARPKDPPPLTWPKKQLAKQFLPLLPVTVASDLYQPTANDQCLQLDLRQ